MARPRKYVDVAELIGLRQSGHSWPAIARRMRLGQGTVFRAYRNAISSSQPFQNSTTGIPKTAHLKLREIGLIDAVASKRVPLVVEPSSWGQAEGAVVERHVRGCGFEPTNELMATLKRKASFYDVSGFVVAAAIERAWRRAQRTPSARPQRANWIAAVVENDLSKSRPAEHRRGSGAPVQELACKIRAD